MSFCLPVGLLMKAQYPVIYLFFNYLLYHYADLLCSAACAAILRCLLSQRNKQCPAK